MNLSIHEEHGIKVRKEEVPASLIVDHIEKNYREICMLEGIDLKINLKDMNLNLDKKYFLPVINNLMANAIQNIDPENKKIEINCHSEDFYEISFTLSNTGRFISPEQQPYLFQSVYDKNKYTSYSKGLGLRFCYLIVSLHKGTIHYHANPQTMMNEFIIKIPRS